MAFATKPQIARRMVARALEAGVHCAWVTGDEVCGGDRHLWLWLESRDQSFVKVVACNEQLWWRGPEYSSGQELAKSLSPQA